MHHPPILGPFWWHLNLLHMIQSFLMSNVFVGIMSHTAICPKPCLSSFTFDISLICKANSQFCSFLFKLSSKQVTINGELFTSAFIYQNFKSYHNCFLAIQQRLSAYTNHYLVLTLPVPYISESCIKIKINFNFLFSHFFVVPQKDFWCSDVFRRYRGRPAAWRKHIANY